MLNPQRVQFISDPDKLVITPTLRKDLFREWINKMVNRIKESSSLTTWIAPALLAVLLGYNIYDKQSTSSELRELNRAIVVLQTQKTEQEKIIDRERQEKFQLTREQEAWREKLGREMMELKLITQGKLSVKMNGNN
jgi:hypothetical protein